MEMDQDTVDYLGVKWHVPENLRNVAKDILVNGTPRRETVRTLLSWFDSERRGSRIAFQIDCVLNGLGLATSPDFQIAFFDSEVEFVKAKPKKPQTASVGREGRAIEDLNPNFDPVPRIGMLPSANKIPVSVTRDAEIGEAQTLMLMHDFSQLPVIQGDRTVHGMISWKSIGRQGALGRPFTHVRDCLESAVEVLNYDVPLFEAVGRIIEKEVVLVKGTEGKITGLVTTSDISLQFRSLSEAFLLLGEIENHIRRLIHGKFTLEELKALIDLSDQDRKVENVSDLTFGEYIRLFENPENCRKANLALDRKVFTARH